MTQAKKIITRKNIKWPCIAMILGIFSCESVIEVDQQLDTLPIVVNSIFAPDSTWTVTVLNSKHVLDRNHTTDENISNEFDTINNARVVVLNEDTREEITLLQARTGKYVLNVKPQGNGDLYTLLVEVPERPTMTATCFLPSPVPIENTTIEIPTDYSSAGSVNVTFNDPPGEKNYYELFIRFEYGDVPQPHWYYRFRSKDPSLEFESPELNYARGMLINDKPFDGQTKTIPLEISNPNFLQGKKEFFIILRSLSEAHYNYRLTVDLQESNVGDPFAQPVQVYTNIQNGVGIFAGYSTSIDSVEIN